MELLSSVSYYGGKGLEGVNWVGSKVYSAVAFVAQGCLDLIPLLPMNPVRQHREIHLVPESAINWIGKATFDQMCRDEVKNHKYSSLVKEIGAKLKEKSHRTDFDYEFAVVDQKDKSGKSVVNAFCAPGGKVMITTALLEKLENERVEDSIYDGEELNDLPLDDKIAAVLGHEITHACANHSNHSFSLALFFFAMGKVVHFATTFYLMSAPKKDEKCEEKKDKPVVEQRRYTFAEAYTVGWLAEKIFSFSMTIIKQSYSRENEFEADCVGMQYAHDAGYNAKGSVWLQKMFVKMQGEEIKAPQGFFGRVFNVFTKTMEMMSSHPPSTQRVERCKHTWEKIKTQ